MNKLAEANVPSHAVQDYAKAIWSLAQRSHEPVSNSALAERLDVSPASASAMVKRLESLGLVEHRPYHGVTLTPAGEALLAETDAVLGAVRRAEKAAQDAGGVHASQLRVGAFPSAASGLVPGAIRTARRRSPHPDVDLDLRVLEPQPALRALARGKLDLALLIESPLDTLDLPEGVELVPVTDDPMMIALPVEHPLASRRSLALTELADEPFLLTELGGTCADSNIVRHACREAGFAPQVRLESEDYNALQGMAAAGLGIALVPRLATVTAYPGVVVRPLRGTVPTRSIVAAVQSERASLIDDFVEALRDAGRALDGSKRLVAVA
jgi:DNA-binding transcriptional LysR family regulator